MRLELRHHPVLVAFEDGVLRNSDDVAVFVGHEEGRVILVRAATPCKGFPGITLDQAAHFATLARLDRFLIRLLNITGLAEIREEDIQIAELERCLAPHVAA